MDDVGVENFEPGDIVLHNDPYLGGSHLPDVNMIRPVFVDGKLVAFVANRAHYPDVGGIAPGSFAGEAKEILHEGVTIPPLKLYRKDQLDDQLLKFFAANVRAPKRIFADSAAQVASIRIGERRLLELIEQEGMDDVAAGIDYLMDYCEDLIRSRVKSVPDGVYRYFDYMDDSGANTDPVRIVCTMTVKGDELTFDFTGTDPQVKCPINAPYAVTCSATYGAAKCILAPDAPLNAGMFRAMKIIAPEGSLVNAQHPVPVAAGNTNASQRLFGIVLGCFFQAIPDMVEACEYGANSDIGLGGVNPRNGDPYVLYMMPVGGLGARPNKDGNSGVINYMGNCSSQPAEVWEAMYPFRVNHWGLRPDSAGAGRFRGGFGYDLKYESLDDDALLSLFTERVKVPPFGLFGGLPAKGGQYILNTPRETRSIDTKLSRLDYPAGATLRIFTCGGGGYGDPYSRDPHLVMEDYLDGLVSAVHARDAYGVVIDKSGELDAAATEKLRSTQKLREEVVVREIVDEEKDPLGRSVSISPDMARKLSVAENDLIELTTGSIPLRGWVMIDEALDGNGIQIPAIFQEVLGLDQGSSAKLRKGVS